MIVIYTADWCKPCQQVKKMFDEAGLEYEEVDIEDTDREFSVLPHVVWSDGSESFGFWKPEYMRKLRGLT